MHPLFMDYAQRLEALHDDAKQVLEGLPDDALDWSPGPDMNTLAVLVTHLAGAERYWIGDMTGYAASDRVRADEFDVSGLTAGDLVQQLDDTLAHCRAALTTLTLADLEQIHLSEPHQREFRVAWSLLHALEHSAIHVGHMQIMRQLWDQQKDAG